MDPLYYKADQRRQVVPINIAAGAAYVEHIIPGPTAKKLWQIFYIEGGVPAKCGVQDFAVNDRAIGLYIAGDASNGALGSYNMVQSFGQIGFIVRAGDKLSVRKGNSGATPVDINLNFYIAEFDA